MKKILLLMLGLVFNGTAAADEHTVGQKDKKFTQSELTIAVGDTVNFRNDDPFSHNVYSLSETKSFDLGSYPRGEARAVTFDKPGVVEIGCAIHFDMSMKINVQ